MSQFYFSATIKTMNVHSVADSVWWDWYNERVDWLSFFKVCIFLL